MSSSWSKLIVNDDTIPKENNIIVFYRNMDSLTHYIELMSIEIMVKSNPADFFQFLPVKIHDRSYNLYCCLVSEDYDSINLLQPFLNEEDNFVVISLLDWMSLDQQMWLSYLQDCQDKLVAFNKKLNLIAKWIVALHSENIYSLVNDRIEWYQDHVEYIQQSLRSFALNNQDGLIYLDSRLDYSPNFSDNILQNKFTDNDLDMVNPTKILIPFGTDSNNFILTINDKFDSTNNKEGYLNKVPKSEKIKRKTLFDYKQIEIDNNDDYSFNKSKYDTEHDPIIEPMTKLFDYSKRLR